MLKIFETTHEITKNFIKLVSKNGRLSLLPLMVERYIALYKAYKSICTAQVTTAVALDESLKEKLKNKIHQITGKKIQIQSRIDESILGGYLF